MAGSPCEHPANCGSTHCLLCFPVARQAFLYKNALHKNTLDFPDGIKPGASGWVGPFPLVLPKTGCPLAL